MKKHTLPKVDINKVMKNIEGTDTKQPTNYPDAKKHQVISFIKSGIRIAACLAGIWGFYEIGFLGLLIAEIVGIKEELV
jgi:hypothetical protein